MDLDFWKYNEIVGIVRQNVGVLCKYWEEESKGDQGDKDGSREEKAEDDNGSSENCSFSLLSVLPNPVSGDFEAYVTQCQAQQQ